MSNSPLHVGFDRLDITPKNGGIPLAGFGATAFRQSASVLDRIYINTVALGNGKQPEVLLLTFDWINVTEKLVERFRAIISEDTGVPKERILIGGTHTHSGPDVYSSMDSIQVYLDDVARKISSTAKRALSDMRPATIHYGTIEAGHEGAWLNFCKHYKMAPVEKKDCYTEADLVDVGDNYGTEYSRDKEHYFYVGHEEEADHMLQIIRFMRQDANDVILVNFQAHAMITGLELDENGRHINHMSSDFPGVLCKQVERLIPNTHCAFYQGAAGNLNPNTRIPEEGILGLTYKPRDAVPYATVLATYVQKACESLTPSETDTIDFVKHIKTGICDHSNDHRIEDAKIVSEFWSKIGKHTPEVREICRKYGFNSPYHAGSVISKSRLPETEDIEMNAIRIGDVAMVTAPCEMFNDNQLFIKKHSPFRMTFVKAYSCGRLSYIPSNNTCMNSYERNCTHFIPGTGDEMANELVEQLNVLYKRR